MVLELFYTSEEAERKPWDLFWIGMLYATIAVFLSIWIFMEYSSLVMVFLIVFASVPLIHSTIIHEERKDTAIKRELPLLKEHSKAIYFFITIFIGFVVALSFWYLVLPKETTEKVFSVQTKTIEEINNEISGGYNLMTIFYKIFMNNLRVLFFSVFFAFFYGAGAVFILTWNASVIAAAVGNFIRVNVASGAYSSQVMLLWEYFKIFPLGLLRYSIHGIPEIAAYFVGGLAGGLISIAVINHRIGDQNFRIVLRDSFDLLAIAVLVLFIAGLLEVFVTPMFF